MLSRRSLLAVTVVLALAAVSNAAGVEFDGYTATGAPTYVKPSTPTTFTVALTNKAVSPKEADRAKIGIPAGFTVAPATVQASATAAGTCAASTWVADGTLIANEKINLKSPSGGSARLCPGATLSVVFSATSAAVDGTDVWTTALLRGSDTFLLTGAQPSVHVDGTPPIVTVGSHPANPSNDSAPTFAFSANEAASLECKVDGGAFAPCTSPKNYSALGDGSHTFTVEATDAAGNTGTASYTWLLETTLPIVTLADKPSPASKSSSASFSFTASEPGTFECKLDTGAFAACTSPVNYEDLADGSHTFSAKATDTAANTGPETSYAWTVDTVSPTASITQKPAVLSNDGSPTFEFAATEAATFECKLDTGAFASCASPKSYAPGDGPHTFTLKATDAAGNSGQASYGWTIDTVAPTVAITQKPNSQSNVRSPTFAFSASETVGFQCKLDAGAFATCTSPYTTELGDGSHTFTVAVTDGAGNTGQAAHTWTIDTVAPTTTITQKPSHPSGVDSATFVFSASETATFQCKLDGAAFASCPSPKNYTVLSDAVHTFVVRATDAAGNTGEEDTYSWLVETDLPVVTLTRTSPINSSAATFFFTANKAATFECKLDGGAFAACVSPQPYAGLPDGPHTLAVRGTGTGGTGPATIHEWTIDTTGPAAAIAEKPANPTNGRSATFAFSAGEPAAFQCKLDDNAFASCVSPQTYTGLGEGRHTFVVRASDAAANLGPEATYAWTIDTRAPAVAITSAPSGLTNATAASFSFSADEPATFQCSFDGVGFEPCSSPASRAGLAEGGHAFIVRATDAAGNVAVASSTWVIDATPPQTTLESGPRARTAVRSARFAFATNDPAGAFQCRLDAGSYTPCTSPKAYARLGLGVHRFMVRATDAAGNADATPAAARWTIGPAATRSAAASALFAPAAGARLTRPPLLRWRAASRATYYNVQLYRAGRKVLTAWPSRTRLQLRMRWRFNGRAEHLKPGVYRWFVWPGYGRVTDLRYGRLLGTSTFVVGRAT